MTIPPQPALPTGPPSPRPRSGVVRRALDFLRAHPILCLLLLSPGIPEYLSSSSALNAIVLNPFLFVFQIVANLGLYGPGVLLIREAMIRWRKGWGSVLLLGAAYAILEEGIALSTFFNSNAGPVGQLGFYGHWLGVNWVWVAGILPVHMIFSISLPILLLGLALPKTRGKSLLSRRGIRIAFVIWGFDVFGLLLLIVRGENFWMGWPIFISSFVVIGLLVLAAYRVPATFLSAKSDQARLGPRRMTVVGALFFPGLLFTQFFGMGVGLPAAVDFGLVILLQGLFLVCILRVTGSTDNERNLLALAFGLILPIAVFGVLAEIALPMTLFADLLFILFFRKLWRRYPPHHADELVSAWVDVD